MLVQCNKTGLLLPTGETFIKLVSEGSHQKRINVHRYLGTDHLFYRKSVIDLVEALGHLTKEKFSEFLNERSGRSEEPYVKRSMLGKKGLIGLKGKVYEAHEVQHYL